MSPLANHRNFKMVLAILRCLSFVRRLVWLLVGFFCRVLLVRFAFRRVALPWVCFGSGCFLSRVGFCFGGWFLVRLARSCGVVLLDD